MLALVSALMLALLREPVSWVVLAVSAAAGALLKPAWWSLVLAGGSLLGVYVFEAWQESRYGGNIDLAGLAGVGAMLLALIAFFAAWLLRRAWELR